jgi:DNA-binding IclR family transcriptional regulator
MAPGGYASTRRVFRIVDPASREGPTLTAKRLARELGTSLSTGYQLISILREEGYIQSDGRIRFVSAQRRQLLRG